MYGYGAIRCGLLLLWWSWCCCGEASGSNKPPLPPGPSCPSASLRSALLPRSRRNDSVQGQNTGTDGTRWSSCPNNRACPEPATNTLPSRPLGPPGGLCCS
uniref:Putative secreted peptide n=1 Tax=Anopheles braziliensis TaxID=58242 RepID=A0A2M3ZX05_9DIPT